MEWRGGGRGGCHPTDRAGPFNQPKDAIQPLTGVVETDWSPATFTMNWKFTRKHAPVSFERIA